MIKRLLLLNGVAISAVVLFHTAGWGLVAMFFWTDRYMAVSVPNFEQVGSFAYFFLKIVEQLAVFAIPAFLFVSGYFIAFATPRASRTISWSIVWNRIKTLLVPYLIWSFLLLILAAFQGKTHSVTGYIRLIATGGTNPAYYYVPLLIQYYLLSPLIVLLARRRWLLLLLLSALIQLSVQVLYYPAILGWEISSFEPLIDAVPKWFFPARIFWFSLGVVTGFHIKNLSKVIFQYRRFLLAAAIILFFAGMFEWELILNRSGQAWIAHRETFIDSLYSIALIFCFLAYYRSTIPLSSQFNELGVRSFGIYLIHSPAMEYTARFIAVVVPGLLAVQILFIPIITLVGFGVPLLLMAAVDRSPARRYYQYFFG